ncbi:hypothetical protein MHK_007108 [Candidatus Magnetomorum sp. HK-1]|nr:hypothetical protein MHK_007108 [Candidatus Magnetomorum sp. HK-1]
MSWIPFYIKKSEDFLCHELMKLRDYVWNKRHEDISEYLYVYENRVWYSSNVFPIMEEFEEICSTGTYIESNLYGNQKNNLLPWETIRTFPYYSDEYGERCYEINRRTIKKFCLLGWMEVNLWYIGANKAQVIHQPDNISTTLKISSDTMNQFIENEYTSYSICAMEKFLDNYLCIRPKKRKKILMPKTYVSHGKTWNVFVSSDLKKFYFGEDERISYTNPVCFEPMINEMDIIQFPKNNESIHAMIANFNSWQTYLHVFKSKEDNQMTKNSTFINSLHQEQKKAINDATQLTAQSKAIIRKISSQTGFSNLDKNERKMILELASKSPRIKMLARMAQHNFIRKEISEFLAKQQTQKSLFLINKDHIQPVKESFIRLFEWVSPMWTPQWAGQMVTASDIPEQKHSFELHNGEITISCLWRSAYNKAPAYIQLSWSANIITGYELWAVFINPETKNIFSEICLGTHLNGGIIIPETSLRFDPAKERWATLIKLKVIQ